MNNDRLEMTFDPNTIEHLGVRMYSTLPPVLAELVANSHDADASTVCIDLIDNNGERNIVISDDGMGMSFEDINGKFLKIGRNRRADEGDGLTPKGRKIIGKKGLGKLSFFGIAHDIEIVTVKDNKKNSFLMSWEKIKESANTYSPVLIEKDSETKEKDGTTITLKKIKRESPFFPEDIANSLSKIFILDKNFKIFIRHNSGDPISVGNERKYTNLEQEFEWKIPDDLKIDSDYENKDKIIGHLIATKKPISPKTNMRGIVLFSRKKLVNAPEYFSDSTSSHIFSYLTGWIEVDFIDDLDEDVIATDRQSVNWDHPEMVKLRKYLQSIIRWLEQDWRKKRNDAREKQMSQATGINISDWFSKLPKEIRDKVEPLVKKIIGESELPEEDNTKAVAFLHGIAPEYPLLHWRHLHPEVQRISEAYYKNKDFYTAVFESIKLYVNTLKTKTGSIYTDRVLLENIFPVTSPKLSVTQKFKRPDGTNFEDETIKNINEGHRSLLMGAWMAFRCQFSHEVVANLRDSGLFTEKDCLDALSLMSHLFHRLDESEVPTSTAASTPTL